MEQSRCRGPASSGPERQREATASSTRLAHHCSCGPVKLWRTEVPSWGSLSTQTCPTVEPSTTSSNGDDRCFQVDVEGPAVSGNTGCHRRHRPNRHPGVHRWVHPRRFTDGGAGMVVMSGKTSSNDGMPQQSDGAARTKRRNQRW